MFTWIICFIITLFFMKMLMRSKDTKRPPGPKGLPFIGVAHKVDPTGLHKSVTKWSEEYGDVMKINVFGDEFVVLNSFETIYDALVLRSVEFAGRPSVYRFKVITGFCNSTIMSDFTPKWLAMKKLLLQKIKMYGTNMLKLEEISLDCIKSMIEELSLIAESGEAVNIKPILHRCITRIITSVTYGRKVDDDAIHRMLRHEEGGDKSLRNLTSGMLLDKFPFLRYFPLKSLNDKLVLNFQLLKETLEAEMQKSMKAYSHGQVNSVMDALIEHKSRNSEHKDEDKLTLDDLFVLSLDMLTAGTITTTRTLTALFACLVNKPKVQQRIGEEIKEVLGNRSPCLQDRNSLPFTEAAILEILRYQTLFPLNFVHMTTTDTSIGGYELPKGTKVFFNLWKLNHDPELWEEPWEFDPERFLDKDGKLLPIDHPRRKRLIAFGAGRRKCAGEALAKNRLFLIVTSLLQQFVFLPESEDKRPSHDPRTYTSGIELYPIPYKVKLAMH